MSWEYNITSSEADFDGAPDWATEVVIDNGGYRWFAENFDYMCKIISPGSLVEKRVSNPTVFSVVAARRKVENIQSGTSDANAQQSFDTVQRPAHYNQSDIECIDAIKASMTLAEFQSYLKGNVLKYLWRYRHKNGLEDVKKAQWYINRLAAELEESDKGDAE